jgi:hypothetical protein
MQVHLDYQVKLLRSKQKEDPEKTMKKAFCCGSAARTGPEWTISHQLTIQLEAPHDLVVDEPQPNRSVDIGFDQKDPIPR